MQYRIYHFNRKEWFRYGMEAFLFTGMIAFCFYNSVWALAAFPAVLWWYTREKKSVLLRERREMLTQQFQDAVLALAAALTAGYSVENAVREAGKDLRLLYDKDACIVKELEALERKLEANQTIEAGIFDFAERSGIEEAETFAEIFAAAKRNGGDLPAIMKKTAGTISQTADTERQVQTILASRRYEQKIMNIIPFAMVLYLRAGCPGFLAPMYGNAAGILIMTGCLALCIGAQEIGRRMLEIEV